MADEQPLPRVEPQLRRRNEADPERVAIRALQRGKQTEKTRARVLAWVSEQIAEKEARRAEAKKRRLSETLAPAGANVGEEDPA